MAHVTGVIAHDVATHLQKTNLLHSGTVVTAIGKAGIDCLPVMLRLAKIRAAVGGVACHLWLRICLVSILVLNLSQNSL